MKDTVPGFAMTKIRTPAGEMTITITCVIENRSPRLHTEVLEATVNAGIGDVRIEFEGFIMAPSLARDL